MKKTTVKAYNGIGKDKVLAGERLVDEPENLDEAVQIEGGGADGQKAVLDAYWSSKVIDIQRQIRAGTTVSAKAQLNLLIAKAKTDPKIAELLKAADIKIPGEGENGASTEAPKTETAPSETPAPEEKPAAEAPKPARKRR